MKKIMSMCMVLVLMVSICSLAFANAGVEDTIVVFEFEAENDVNNPLGNETDDPDGNETEDPDGNESDIDDDTEEEIEIMNNTLGAEIRLLQLEKSITKNLLKGERAVAVLKVMEYNTTELETILEEMRLLLEEVQAANASGNDSVQQFVDLKSDARKLTKSFRDTIKELLSEDKIRDLKEQIKEIVGDELQNYSKKIQNRIKQFNRNQIHRLYVFFGNESEPLGDEYQNGTMSMEEVKAQLRNQVNAMNKEKKNKIFSELKKDKINKKNYANEEAADALEDFGERANDRAQGRSNKGNKGDNGNNNGNKGNNGNGNPK